MSIQAITWAFDQSVKPSGTKFVLVVMANCANEAGDAYPSIDHLCHATGQDRKTVIEGVARLVGMGLMMDTGERKGRTGQVKVFRLTVPETEQLKNTENGTIEQSQKRDALVETVPFLPPNSTVFPSKQYRKRDTEPSVTLKEPKTKKTTTNLTVVDLVSKGVEEQVATDFLTLRKAKRAPLTNTAMAGIEREAAKEGWALNAALAECVMRGWQGFKADWVRDKNKPATSFADTDYTLGISGNVL